MILFGLPTFLAHHLPFYRFFHREPSEFNLEEALASLPLELRENFISASNHMRQNGGSMSQDELLYLYGLYKVVTVGPTNFNEQPGKYAVRDRVKWRAWYDQSDKTKSEAAEMYIDKIENANIGWKRGQKSQSSGSFGVKPSRMMMHDDNQTAPTTSIEFDHNDEAIWKAVRDGHLKEFEVAIQNAPTTRVQCVLNTHYNGLTPLHWAADRGNLDIIKRLLELNAPINAFSTDDECNTPLHLAIIADHVDCAKYLVDRGADYDLLDADEQTPFHYADSQAMKSALLL